MKISYNWLKQYIDLDVSPDDLSTILTDIGLEVEGLEKFQSVKGGLEGIVIGEVKTCVKHPNADKLSVTTVDVGGEELLPIVCGAPNVAAGQKVVVATVGTTLYSGEESFKIKKAKIRGEVSQGMICAEDELGLGTSHEGIMVLPAGTNVGMPAIEYFNIEEDFVYEIGLTPNRSDATSHIGSARDLVAGLNRLKETDKYKLKLPSVDDFKVDDHSLDIDVIVDDVKACPRYSGITISGIQVKESPDWLKNRLNAIGLRPINNIVDITNYVLHETGQPLHAFDADQIKGNKVVVRKLKQDSSFVTLDEVERKLHADDLMICNTEEGMCMAGVFGGISSGVTGKTTNIFLESAFFESTHIRKTSKRHALQTDASFRFERGTDPNITVYALMRAALLIKEIAGGKVSSEIKDVYPTPLNDWEIEISYKNVDRLIGKKIPVEIIREILTNLGIQVLEETGIGMKLQIPTFKTDVKREVDVIEEILRIYGYNNIEFDDKIHSSVSLRPKPDLEKLHNKIAAHLTGNGFSEIMNNSLTKSEYIVDNSEFNSEQSIHLLNPLSKDLDILRQTLLFGGLEVIAYNSNRKISDLKLYEFGKIYRKKNAESEKEGLKNYFEEKHLTLFASGLLQAENWNSTNEKANFFFLKGIVESIFSKLGIDSNKLDIKESSSANCKFAFEYFTGDMLLAVVAGLNKKLLDEFDIKQDVFVADLNWEKLIKLLPKNDLSYRAVSKFPSVRRDLAMVIDKEVSFEEMKSRAFKAERKLLKSVGIFDIYEGDKIPEGKKSYALSFVLQDNDKTLTDKVIDKAMNRIQKTLETELNAVLR
jgi:phenylalanyl-tRNA synthetase beta chain